MGSVALAPANPCGYDERGLTLAAQGNLEPALADLLYALDLEPTAKRHYWCALLLVSKGELSKALPYFESAAEAFET